MTVDESLPSKAVPLAVWVLVFSLINVLASVLVIVMRWRADDDKFGMIPLAAIAISVGIVSSMAQQIHFIVPWRDIRDAAYENAVTNPRDSAATFTSTFNELDTNLFLIRFYCYNVTSLLYLFWAIGLWRSTLQLRREITKITDEHIVLGAKGFALLFPVLIVGIMRSGLLDQSALAQLLWSNLLLILSTSLGSIFLVLILLSYIHVRHKVVASEKAASKFQFSFRLEPNDSDQASAVGSTSRPHPAVESMRSVTYDRWLIARFLTSFAASNVMQSTVIIYYVLLYRRTGMLIEQNGPDYSMKTNLTDLAITMPSVSSGLLIFIVFGTTAPFRRVYTRWITCQSCRKVKGKKRNDRDEGAASRGGRDNSWVDDTPGGVGADDFNPTLSSLGADADDEIVDDDDYLDTTVEQTRSERSSP